MRHRPVGGEEPPHGLVGTGAGRLSPRDGASTELVTLKVRIPEACYGTQAEAKRKRRGARPKVSATKNGCGDITLRRHASRQDGVSGEIGNRAGRAKSRQRPRDRNPGATGTRGHRRGPLHRTHPHPHGDPARPPSGFSVAGAGQIPPGHSRLQEVIRTHSCSTDT